MGVLRLALEPISETLVIRRRGARFSGNRLVLELKVSDRDRTVITSRTGAAAPVESESQVRSLMCRLLAEALLAGQAVRLLGLSVTGTGDVKDRMEGQAMQPRPFVSSEINICA